MKAHLILLGTLLVSSADACCPAPPSGKPVVNADQTVIMIWDAKTKTQHFIRKASFKSEADDFGFLVPTPNEPDLKESGNDAFPYLMKVTAPEEIVKKHPGGGCSPGCGVSMPAAKNALSVRVLKEVPWVAGFSAVVLEASSANALVAWLKKHGYNFSPEVQTWAKPYIEKGWKITALKVAKGDKQKQSVGANALRLTFKTDTPLFPYREPDYGKSLDALNAKRRLLRIYFIAEARYKGILTKETPWTGTAEWSGKLTSQQRSALLKKLNLPPTTGPEQFWLTEFEDVWPYRVMPADVYFWKDENQSVLKREPITVYVSSKIPNDAMAYALAFIVIVPPVWTRLTRRERSSD